MRGSTPLILISVAWSLAGCSADPADVDDIDGYGGSGAIVSGGATGQSTSGGSSTGGAFGGFSAGGNANGGFANSGGAAGASANNGGSGTSSGGSVAGGASAGGASSGGNPSNSGGRTSMAGGAPSGGTGSSGGASSSGGRSSGGASSGGASSGGGSSIDCSVLPINPKASTQARKLLCYLYNQYGNRVLSGQQETSWASNPEVDMNYINAQTGKYPAVRGLDYLYNGTSNRAIAWWNAGGIPKICYHMGAPPLSDTYENSKGTAQGGIDAVLTPGTASNTAFMQKLDFIATELQKLQAANVPVLWRPFHEAGGNWFWWSKESGAQYVRLWKFMYDHLTSTKGLNNLLWMHPFNGEPQASFYPGKEFADLGGADTYSTSQPFTSMFNTTRAIVGSTMPIALHENGLMPDPDTMFGSGTKTPWVLFNTWADTYLTQTNSAANLKKIYASQYTITRDELPNLK